MESDQKLANTDVIRTIFGVNFFLETFLFREIFFLCINHIDIKM